MESLKKAFRSFCFILMILLAATGVGLAGGVPLPTLRRPEDNPVSIELYEPDKVNEKANLEEAEEKT